MSGKRKVHEVGKIFRKRYNDFLGNNVREIEVRSMYEKRMLATAQLFVDGMYKGYRTDKYHTVPIHTIKEQEDPVKTLKINPF